MADKHPAQITAERMAAANSAPLDMAAKRMLDTERHAGPAHCYIAMLTGSENNIAMVVYEIEPKTIVAVDYEVERFQERTS